ncbi:MAG: ribosome maturation factor RimM [Alphaproteobacteria bacterium]|nr:16S rRNA processing protein RimM [Alphaproteobacteria bacterium]MCR4555736.1 ribosome maturation factor RimM [Alphaproteobacteria bacterium]
MVEILRVTAAFGIKGAVRVFLYTDDINHYKKIYDRDGNEFRFKLLNQKGGSAVIKLDSIDNRNDAEKLKGASFYVKKEDLPKLDENQFFICDLIGQKVSVIGEDVDLEIIDVKNFGAGDLIEISEERSKDSFFVPFTKENFPETDGEISISFETYRNFKN